MTARMSKLHLAQLNVGRLVAPTDDPRVAAFMDALDLVNGIGKRSPGFVWMMEGSGEPGTGNTSTKIDGDSRYVPNLTVWEDVQSLESFVWNTVHRQFYARRSEWFEVMDRQHFVMWWIPERHIPTLSEALERLETFRANGPGPQAFGWADIDEATLWRTAHCKETTA